MRYEPSHIAGLLLQHLSGDATVGQRQELDEWLAASSQHAALLAEIEDETAFQRRFAMQSASQIDALSDRLLRRVESGIAITADGPGFAARRTSFFSRSIFKFSSAAAIILILCGAAYFWLNRPKQERSSTTTALSESLKSAEEILPGSEKAVLTLSNGKKIPLGAGNEMLVDSGVQIKKEDGELIYSESNIVAFNTMTTPRGGQYKLTLPDGTKVWLNAASSVTYPTTFTGNERRVNITGELYFEVARNASKPFIVETGTSSIRVIGTHFNVNAYEDESDMKTTLIEGVVKIDEVVLKPGEAFSHGRIETDVDVSQAIAWKNGVFNFHKMPLSTAMRQLARWYDIDVVYENKIPNFLIFGEMGRDLNLSQVLEILSEMNVRYKMIGRKLVILS